jgi:hypothetical protein
MADSSSPSSPSSRPTATADRIAERLAKLLGPHTARVAVKTFALRALGRGPETLTPIDVPALAEAMRPMLRTLIGKEKGEAVVKQMLRDFGQ